jgi:glutamate/tyrosine decarboxylase-like PLP-dependent enzyme
MSSDMSEVFGRAAALAAGFRDSLPTRRVASEVDLAGALALFQAELPDGPADPVEVIDELARRADPGIVASAGPRFFGFVNGGGLPAASAADLLAIGWAHPAFYQVLTPAGAAAERVAGGWVKELLGIPGTASVGFVTGAQAANTVGIAAARQHLLAERGYDVGTRGLIGAPAIRVLVGEERHATIDASLRMLGLGTDCMEPVAAGPNGVMDMADLARVLDSGDRQAPTIVVLQTGNVNTGGCDNLRAGCDLAHRYGAWAHVDGAFGLWAAASPSHRRLTDGIELADSGCTDAHKWPNVPYDSGLAICAHPQSHAAAMSYSAAYLSGSESARVAGSFSPGDLVPESSRRARGFAVWAALRELGRSGVADLVDRCCALARRLADGLAAGGVEIVNDVVINQVLFCFPGRDADAVAAAVQAEGTCWLGGTTWRGRRLLRVSVSNYATTESDIDASVTAILAAGRSVPTSAQRA